MKLEGKVAIVTGATSGMGRATAVLFAKEGAKVVVTGRNEERAQAVVDEIKGNGGEAIYVIVDASNVEDCKKIFDATIEAFGTVDILVNNAGMLSMSPLLEVSIEEWNKVFAVNVTSALYLTQLCAPVMKEKGKGVIHGLGARPRDPRQRNRSGRYPHGNGRQHRRPVRAAGHDRQLPVQARWSA